MSPIGGKQSLSRRVFGTVFSVALIAIVVFIIAWIVVQFHVMKEPARIANSINYKNDFALATWAPLSLCEDGKKTYHVDIFVDKSSVELFVDGGRIAMTNLVFPVAPYENVKLYTQDGKAEFKNLKVHKLGL